MDAQGPENISHAELSSAQISQQVNNPGLALENQLHGVSDIASARNFFVPKMDMQAIVAPMPGLENSASAAAMKAASGAISPMLQLIMRLPGHLGIFSSFLEALKGLFMPHDLLSNFNPAVFVPGVDLTHAGGLTHIGQSLAQPHALDLSFSSAHAFQTMSGEFLGTAASPHLHMNAFDSWKQSINVSARVDLSNPQFEGVTSAAHQASNNAAGQFLGRGDNLAGPGLSAQAITPKLAPAQRIFSSKFFESASGNSNANTLLASNSQTTSSGITSSTTNLNQMSADADNLNSSIPKADEHLAPQDSSNLSGLRAKALSLNDVLHNKHLPSTTLHKHLDSNPFSKLASSTRQAFQSGQSIHLNSSSHHAFSHIEPTKIIGHSATDHGALSNHYTVKSGDTLWRISKNVLGSGDKWTQLYKFNNGVIGANPNMIFSGQKLALSGFDGNQIQSQLAHHTVPSHLHHAEHQLASQVTPAHIHNAEHQLANQSHSPSTHHVEHQLASQPQPAPVHGVSHQLATHSQPSSGINHNQVKHENVVAQTAVHSINNHGLAVENTPDQVMSGSGGAQAATNTHSAVNKTAVPGQNSQSKSVVSFSLLPD